MSAVLTMLNFEGHDVRVHDDEGQPWFVLADICKILGIKNPSMAALSLDEDERSKINLGRQGETIIVSEPGANWIVLRSDQAARHGTKAWRFRRWLTHDVLPSLRKFGVYRMQEDDPDLPALADGKVFGLKVAKVNAAATMISVVNRIYGPEAARKLYESEPGLPKMNGLAVGDLTGTESDDPVGCLHHLLRMSCGNGLSVGEAIRATLDEVSGPTSLPQLGIAIDPPGHKGRIAIASDHPFLDAAFKATQWAGEWRIALNQLDGAKAGRAVYAGKVLPATLIPTKLVRASL